MSQLNGLVPKLKPSFKMESALQGDIPGVIHTFKMRHRIVAFLLRLVIHFHQFHPGCRPRRPIMAGGESRGVQNLIKLYALLIYQAGPAPPSA